MPLRPILFVALLVLIMGLGAANPAYSQTPSEKTAAFVCKSLQSTFDKMASQIPIQVDFATRLIGLSAMHLGDRCFVNISYLLLDEAFIKEMVTLANMDGDAITRDEAITFLNRIEGRDMLKEEAKAQIQEGMAKLMALPNIRLTVRYQTMGIIHPFEIDFNTSAKRPGKTRGSTY